MNRNEYKQVRNWIIVDALIVKNIFNIVSIIGFWGFLFIILLTLGVLFG